MDQAGFGQFGEALGEHAFTDAGNGLGQHRESRRTLQQQAENDSRPAFTEQTEGTRQTLVAFSGLFEEPLRGQIRLCSHRSYSNLQKVSSSW